MAEPKPAYRSRPEQCPRCRKFRAAGTLVQVRPLSEFEAMSEGPTYACVFCAPAKPGYGALL